MRLYTVHAPLEGTASPERFAFVKDGFSWPAFFLPLLWILWHRLWLALVWYVAYLLVLAWIGRLTGDTNATIAAILGGVLFALEANNIRRWSLDSRGWSEIGAARGANLGEAEARFFDGWLGGRSAPVARREAVSRAAYPPGARADAPDEPILGLFPEPER